VIFINDAGEMYLQHPYWLCTSQWCNRYITYIWKILDIHGWSGSPCGAGLLGMLVQMLMEGNLNFLYLIIFSYLVL